MLGVCYYFGIGLRENREVAKKYLSQAAEQNHAAAQYLLGTIYLEGRFVAADQKKGEEYTRMALENGFEETEDDKYQRSMILQNAQNTKSRVPPRSKKDNIVPLFPETTRPNNSLCKYNSRRE